MLTRFIKFQLVLFTILTIVALVALGWYYLRVPSMKPFEIGRYTLHADLPRSGGLYATGRLGGNQRLQMHRIDNKTLHQLGVDDWRRHFHLRFVDKKHAPFR